jgi:hypothetical protein
MRASTSVHDLKTLIQSFHPVVVIESVEEERVRDLLVAVADQTWKTVFEWSVTRGLVPLAEPVPVPGTVDPSRLLLHLDGLRIEGIFLLKDLARHLEDAKVARLFRETAQGLMRRGSTMVLVGSPVSLPREIEQEAIRYELAMPDRDELLRAVNSVIQSIQTRQRFVNKLTDAGWEQLLEGLQGLTLNQARQVVAGAILNDQYLTPEDVRFVQQQKSQLIREGGILEYYPVDDNRFELGGFGRLKAWLERAAVGFSPEAAKLNLSPPRGILIVGVPGCGKSLAAKVIARVWELPLLKLDAGRLFDKFIGESEKNFRKAIDFAEAMAPAVLWIDEIEKALVASGSSESDGGLSRRLFGAFLTWLQEKRQEVFVVATANNLGAMPPELLRKGRFDEIFFVDLPTAEEREAILKIHLALRKQDPQSFDLAKIVAVCDGFSGAEIEQAVIAGCYRALARKRSPDTATILEEIGQTVPLSVTRREDVEQLRELAKDRFVPVR